jgi:hypothetical protein
MLFLPPVIIVVALTSPPSALSLVMKRSARKLARLVWRLKQDLEVVADVVAVVAVVVIVVVATSEVNGAAPMIQPRPLLWELNALIMCRWWNVRIADGIRLIPVSIVRSLSIVELPSPFLLRIHTVLLLLDRLLLLDWPPLVLGRMMDHHLR